MWCASLPCSPAPPLGRTKVPNLGGGDGLTWLILEPLNLEPGLWPRPLEPTGSVLGPCPITPCHAPGPWGNLSCLSLSVSIREPERGVGMWLFPTLYPQPLFTGPLGERDYPLPPTQSTLLPTHQAGGSTPTLLPLVSPLFSVATGWPLLFFFSGDL